MTSISRHLVDVHAHLCDAAFDDDLDAVLARARAAGVDSVIAVGENLADARKNLALSAMYPMIKAAAGLYPTYLEMERAQEMAGFIRDHRQDLAAIATISRIKGIDPGEVAETVAENAAQLYPNLP